MTVNIVRNPSNTTYAPAIAATGSTTTYTINTVGGGGGGGSNSILTTSGWSVQQSPTVAILNSLDITPRDNADAIIRTNHNEINLDKLYKTVMMIADKMMIIADDPYFTEKYPTLKDAYEQYQTLLELYKQGEKSVKDI
jgi:hypothetical protein